MEFYICEHCGNIVGMVKKSGVPIVCCGQNMTKLIPSTSDGAKEKHVPVAAVSDNIVTVKVGSAAHPMLDAHYIEWIAIETKEGVQRKELKPGDSPEVSYALTDKDSFVAAYAYCNLHGLWKA